MKLDTKLNITSCPSNTLFLAYIYRPKINWRVFENVIKAHQWCVGRTNVGDSVALGNGCECAAHDSTKPETCAWRIEPLIIYS